MLRACPATIALASPFRNHVQASIRSCSVSESAKAVLHIVEIKLAKELYRKITEKGIKNFPSFHYTITETEIVNSCKLSKELGKICKPSWSGIPELPWNGNWLLAKEDFTWKESLRKWERKRVFESPDNGHTWDEELYKV